MNHQRIINYQFGAKGNLDSIRCFLGLILKVFKDEIYFNFGGSEVQNFGP